VDAESVRRTLTPALPWALSASAGIRATKLAKSKPKPVTT
jgi:hypothetical protein